MPSYDAPVPKLDMMPAGVAALRAAADALHQMLQQQNQPVLVCCALGYSRSVAVVLVYLLRQGNAHDLQAALKLLQQARPDMVVSPDHQQQILKAAHE